MTSPTLNEQIAIRLGWKKRMANKDLWYPPREKWAKLLPNWSDCRGAADELLAGLTDEQWTKFCHALSEEMPEYGFWEEFVRFSLTATPKQLCKSWLRATEPQ